MLVCVMFFFQAEDGIRELVRSRGLGDVYKRQVQAWRANDWRDGAWSIARFELKPAGTGGTRLVFTHHGVPDSHHKGISQGWKDYYWTPLGAWLSERAKRSGKTRATKSGKTKATRSGTVSYTHLTLPTSDLV